MSKSRKGPDDDGKIECILLSGKFHEGRDENRKVHKKGDTVRLTPVQFQNFGDIVERVKPETPEAEAETEVG